MSVRVYVPSDTTAVSVGADRVAQQIQQQAQAAGLAVTLVRTGSRGLFYLEPLVEVETPTGRWAYGPVTVADVPSVLAANFLHGGPHPLHPALAGRDRALWRPVAPGLCEPVEAEVHSSHPRRSSSISFWIEARVSSGPWFLSSHPSSMSSASCSSASGRML